MTDKPQGVSRRQLLGAAGIGALGAGALGAAASLAGCSSTGSGSGGSSASAAAQVVPFYGDHQAGITTTAQDRMAFAAFDITTKDRAELADLLRKWSAAAEEMTRGQLVNGPNDLPQAPPADTGEAIGLKPGHLTITLGYGPGLFDDRFGLAAKKPKLLKNLPHFAGDRLDEAWTGGDLSIQACADDPQVAFHAVRDLARIGMGVVGTRWLELGFGRTSSTSREQDTQRNLMGFKDGTRNITSDQSDYLHDYVWVTGADQPWMNGGTYQVVRRIRMLIESWDRDILADQEAVFGRDRMEGAPLSGKKEFDEPDFAATDSSGNLLIPADAHMRLAAPENNNGIRMLRRGYSFTDGIDPVTTELDAGLFFVAYVSDPQHFITVQTQLAGLDALNEYIVHTGSAIFACPAGITSGGHWGQGLFD